MAQHGQPDVLITDPSRRMHTDVANAIGQTLMPKRVVYVSCNPVTQARDLQLLDAWYSVEKLQPIDMFPHTWHIENVALLVHRTAGSFAFGRKIEARLPNLLLRLIEELLLSFAIIPSDAKLFVAAGVLSACLVIY